MKYYLLLVFFLSVSSLSDEGVGRASPQWLVDNSDIVAIVGVVEGKVTKTEFRLAGEVDHFFKGDLSKKEISFKHDAVYYSDTPNRLGQSYVVFLKKIGQEFVTLEAWFSVIEIGYIYRERDDIDLVLSKSNLLRVDLVAKDDYFIYPEMCTNGVGVLCSGSVDILRYLFGDGQIDKK